MDPIIIKDKYTVSTRMEAVRNGVVLKVIMSSGINVTMQSTAEIKMAMSGFISFDADLDLLNDRLRPYQIVNGTEYPMGEFVVATAERTRENNRDGWHVEAYDLGHIVKQCGTESRIYLPEGTKYIDAVKELLIDCGIEKVLADPSDLTMTTAREDWEIGTDYLSIINALLSEINYGTLWFDNSGVARVQKRKQGRERVPIDYAPSEYSILFPSVVSSTDAYSAYNVFTVVVSSPDLPPMTATAVNDSPLSPISTVNRGREIHAPVQFLDNISSQAELKEYVENWKFNAMQSTETVTFETIPIPIHQVDELVNLDAGQYKETEWSLSLGFGGRYTHSARRTTQL